MSNSQEQWMPDNASDVCLLCSKRWSSTIRRHHCRKCCRLVCATCSPNKAYLSDDEGSKKERCCDECFREISYRKTIFVPKSHVADDEVEWMRNDESKCCVRCQSKFSLGNRRHHCRNCGVLVCKKCSENKMQFEDGGDTLDAEAQRCCDVCFEGMRKLRQAEIEAKAKILQEAALLSSTSKVTRSLMKVFFLDGSIRTVKICESSNVSEMSSEICYGVKAAMFEVREDIKDRSQFTLLKPNDTASDLIDRWERDGMTRVKLVLPFYDIKLMLLLKGHKASEKEKDRLKVNQVAKGIVALGRETSTESSAGMTSEVIGASIEDLTSKLADSRDSFLELTKKYESLEKKFETMKAIHKKNGRDQAKRLSTSLALADLPVLPGGQLCYIYSVYNTPHLILTLYDNT